MVISVTVCLLRNVSVNIYTFIRQINDRKECVSAHTSLQIRLHKGWHTKSNAAHIQLQLENSITANNHACGYNMFGADRKTILQPVSVMDR